MKYTVLYNPLAGEINDTSFHRELTEALKGHTLEFYDVTKIEDTAQFFQRLESGSAVIVAGGDGTLNRFINDCSPLPAEPKIYYYAAGSGNDFWHDIGKTKGDGTLADLSLYTVGLPTVTVNGKSYKFINGVGYGIDGYCCEVGDKLKAEGKKVDYTGIAIKGLLFHYKPANATVTVDGVTKNFKKVWIAPTMNGRYYGGGMMPTPAQDRLNDKKTISLCVFHRSGKLKTLMMFPSLFKGEHIKKEKNVAILTGHTITVKFDRPCALQIDGETILGVTEYTVNAGKL